MNQPPRSPRSLRILLCEGSSLSAREALSALGPCGYVIDVCDPDPFCLGRFSRFVRRVYRSPAAGADPQGYLAFLLDHLRRIPYDVLLPVQEQAFLFSRAREQIQPLVGLAIADFSTFARVQSKVGFFDILDTLGIPHPHTTRVRTRAELEACTAFPYYVKTEYGTASSGVWKVQTGHEQAHLATHLQASGQLDGARQLLVQEVVSGPFCMAQAIFDHGHLLAFHCWQRHSEGARGSSSAKVSVQQPLVEQHLRQLGEHLGWHGCLAIDYLLDPEQATPLYIDANPRLVECMNATLSGLNLAEVLVRLSIGEHLADALADRADIRSHMLMMALLGVAEKGGTRRDLLHEIGQAGLRRGIYHDSREELTPLRLDFLSLLPIFVVTTQLLCSPTRGLATASRTVKRYALSAQAIQVIQQEMGERKSE